MIFHRPVFQRDGHNSVVVLTGLNHYVVEISIVVNCSAKERRSEGRKNRVIRVSEVIICTIVPVVYALQHSGSCANFFYISC